MTEEVTQNAFHRESGISLVSVLASLAVIGVAAFAALRGISSYYDGKKKVQSLGAATELERLLLNEISQVSRDLVFGGCSSIPTWFTGFSKTISGSSVNLGTLRRVTNKTEINQSAAGSRETGQRSYQLAQVAREACPGTLPGAASTTFSTCYRFLPNTTLPAAQRLASHSFLNSTQIFLKVDSQIIDLRGNNPLRCSQVRRGTDTSVRRCSTITQASVCNSRQESAYLGSGLRHDYSLFWETGTAGKRIYNYKKGVMYVPNVGS